MAGEGLAAHVADVLERVGGGRAQRRRLEGGDDVGNCREHAGRMRVEPGSVVA